MRLIALMFCSWILAGNAIAQSTEEEFTLDATREMFIFLSGYDLPINQQSYFYVVLDSCGSWIEIVPEEIVLGDDSVIVSFVGSVFNTDLSLWYDVNYFKSNEDSAWIVTTVGIDRGLLEWFACRNAEIRNFAQESLCSLMSQEFQSELSSNEIRAFENGDLIYKAWVEEILPCPHVSDTSATVVFQHECYPKLDFIHSGPVYVHMLYRSGQWIVDAIDWD